MTREELRAIATRSFTIDDIEYGAPLTPPYRDKAQAQIESALTIQWWRGYYAGVDLACNMLPRAADEAGELISAAEEVVRAGKIALADPKASFVLSGAIESYVKIRNENDR